MTDADTCATASWTVAAANERDLNTLKLLYRIVPDGFKDPVSHHRAAACRMSLTAPPPPLQLLLNASPSLLLPESSRKTVGNSYSSKTAAYSIDDVWDGMSPKAGTARCRCVRVCIFLVGHSCRCGCESASKHMFVSIRYETEQPNSMHSRNEQPEPWEAPAKHGGMQNISHTYVCT